MSRTTAQRRQAILEILNRDGFAGIGALTGELGISPATIRRDLAELDRAGKLRRTYGGAVSSTAGETPYREKLRDAADAKQRIASVAASLVQPGWAVGFTGGTTTLYVARRLPRHAGLTVATNALTIAMELAGSDVRVIVTAGELRAATFELVGPFAEPALAQIHLDVVFVGVDGISVAAGLTTHNPVEAQTNRRLLERAERVVVVADARKLGRRTFAQIVPLDGTYTLVTDSDGDAGELQAIRETGMRVMVAQ